MRRRDPQAAGAAEDLAVHLAGPAHGGGVDDGQELLEVVDEDAIEEVLVAVLEGSEADVPLERVLLPRDVPVDPERLLLHGAHRFGQQPDEAEGLPLLEGEGGALVVHRVIEERGPAAADLDAEAALAVLALPVPFHPAILAGCPAPTAMLDCRWS